MAANPTEFDIAALARQVATGEVTASAVLEAQLAEVDRLEPLLGAIITDTRERARLRACTLDAGSAARM